MGFTGLTGGELNDIRALNARYLGLARRRSSPAKSAFAAALGDESAEGLVTMSETAADRLADMPFLLFDLSDVGPDTAGGQGPDLFAERDPVCDDLKLLGLCFAWHLSRRDPFALRVTTGATRDWSDWLAAQAYSSLPDLQAQSPGPLRPVLTDLAIFWPGLVTAVRGRRTLAWQALRAAGLQHLLNRQGAPVQQRLAARRRIAPFRRVSAGRRGS